MLDRDCGPTKTYGFLVAVELEEGGHTPPEKVPFYLADALSWVEGAGDVDIEALGEIEELEDDPK